MENESDRYQFNAKQTFKVGSMPVQSQFPCLCLLGLGQFHKNSEPYDKWWMAEF